METIAVYWEPVIRTYGFNLLEKQVLCQLCLPLDKLGVWSGALKKLEDEYHGFRLVWSLIGNDGVIQFFLLCDDSHWKKLSPFWDSLAEAGFETGGLTKTEAEVVYFQGPHFGDRYGIMDYTYKALASSQVPLLAATCSAASIYLVVPAGWGRRTQDALGQAFDIPTQVKGKADLNSGAHR